MNHHQAIKTTACGLLASTFVLIFQASVSSAYLQSSESQSPSRVELKKDTDGWRLLRNGTPYYINGVGCDGEIGDLASTGANSIRTWHYNQSTRQFLDQAHAQGLTVTVGIWLGHERHGVNYQDYDTMTKQIDTVLQGVNELKDHPAVLAWGIGNEMEGEGANPAVWSHIQHLAESVKKLDPNHPVMTVIADIGGRKVEAIHKLCPSVDIIGINSYGGAPSIPERYRKLNGTKPYVLTEFGPVGTWEVPKNNIDAILEPLGQDKAAWYAKSYSAVKADRQSCLGSYAFLWGHKQEATATWFGMLLPNGKRTTVVDTMSELWTGKKPENCSPVIASCTLVGPNEVDQNQTVRLKLDVSDPENDPLSVKWVLTDESSSYVTGGDLQSAPKTYDDSIIRGDKSGAEIKLPESGGLYRIYAYVDDGQNGGASANVPIRVKGPIKTKPGAKAKLPMVVYSETFDDTPFAPSGFMGSTDSVKLDPKSKDDPQQGEHCLKVDYTRGDLWAGVVWQNPVNDWGDANGGFDLTGAKKLTFWARGKNGDEEIKFGVGLIGRDKPFFDTTKKEQTVKLTGQWRQFTFDLAGADLQRIKTGFLFAVAGQGQPLTFYLDEIKFE